MMKLAVMFALVAIAACDGPTAVASKLKYTPQEKFLAANNVGNFACRVDSVEVVLDSPGEEDKSIVSTEDLSSYLSQTATLEWAHVNQFFFAGLDGRNTEKNLGTGGGDMGEFIQALQAYTKVTGTVLTAEEVSELFERFLRIMSRSKFFFETDEKAYRKLAIATGCQNLKIAEVGDKRKKQSILDHYANEEMADYIGDPYINFLARNFEDLGLNRDYITFAIQAFHKAMWKNNLESESLCYEMMKGRLDPKALIFVKTPGYCVDQGLAPLVSSQLCAGQAFIEHTDAVKLFRRELVQLIAKPGDNPQDILAEFNSFAQNNRNHFWEQYTGLPTFTVTFKHTSPLLDGYRADE